MTKSLKNVKNEKCTLKDLEYGEENEKCGKFRNEWCFIQKTLVVASHFILKGQSGNPARIERETMSSKTKRKTTKQSKAHISLYKG